MAGSATIAANRGRVKAKRIIAQLLHGDRDRSNAPTAQHRTEVRAVARCAVAARREPFPPHFVPAVSQMDQWISRSVDHWTREGSRRHSSLSGSSDKMRYS